MRAMIIAVALACATSGSAAAQSAMTLDDFVTRANRIPLNPSSLLRPDAHRLKGETERAIGNVMTEVRQARTAGRSPPACPAGDRVSLNPQQFLAHLNAIPASRRRGMTVTDGVRDWMRARYPCPGG